MGLLSCPDVLVNDGTGVSLWPILTSSRCLQSKVVDRFHFQRAQELPGSLTIPVCTLLPTAAGLLTTSGYPLCLSCLQPSNGESHSVPRGLAALALTCLLLLCTSHQGCLEVRVRVAGSPVSQASVGPQDLADNSPEAGMDRAMVP